MIKFRANAILMRNYWGYTIHLAESDELLSFDDFLSYIGKYQVPNEFFHYATNHRFEKMEGDVGQ